MKNAPKITCVLIISVCNLMAEDQATATNQVQDGKPPSIPGATSPQVGIFNLDHLKTDLDSLKTDLGTMGNWLRNAGVDLTIPTADLATLSAELTLLGTHLSNPAKSQNAINDLQNFESDLPALSSHLATPIIDLSTLGNELANAGTNQTWNLPLLGKALVVLGTDFTSIDADIKNGGTAQSVIGQHLVLLGKNLMVFVGHISGASFASSKDQSATKPESPTANSIPKTVVLVLPQPTLADTNMTAAATNLIASGRSLTAYLTNGLDGNPATNGLDTNLYVFSTNLTSVGTSMVSALTNSPHLPYKVFFTTGAKFQNPYAIHLDPGATSATLTNNGNSTVPFLEFDYLNRFVLRDPTESDPKWHSVDQVLGDGRIQALWPFLHFPDIDVRFGFVFANGQATSNFSASTIAGGGDFYNDASIGLPFMRYNSPSQSHQLTLDIGGGLVTDRTFETVHPNAFVGVGYQVSFVANSFFSTPTNLIGFLSARAGVGWADIPAFTRTATNVIVSTTGGLPQFDFKSSPTLGVSLTYPLNSSIYLNIGGNVYFRENPAPWNITVGASMPFGQVANVFKPLIGN